MISAFFRRDTARRRAIEALHVRLNAASRAPVLYTGLGVPDTVEGRFESLCLHAILLLRRLKGLPAPAGDVAQDLIDSLFRQLDSALRELGVGDFGVPKRMKKLGKAFYGRVEAYEPGLDGADRKRLAAALARNVLGVDDAAAARPLADYVLASQAALDGADLTTLLEAGLPFAEPSAFTLCKAPSP